MRIPRMPQEKSISSHHETLKQVVQFIKAIHENGLGVKGFTQKDIDKMTEASQAGKIVFNETTGKQNRSEINVATKVVTWGAF